LNGGDVQVGKDDLFHVIFTLTCLKQPTDERRS
jgi:hypothetical protein